MKIIIDIPYRIYSKGLIPTNRTDVEVVAYAIADCTPIDNPLIALRDEYDKEIESNKKFTSSIGREGSDKG